MPPLEALVRARGAKRGALQRRLSRSLASFIVRTPWPVPPEGELICIADAMLQMINRSWYTVFFVLLRGIDAYEAAIAPPVVLAGKETIGGWAETLNALPHVLQSRIRALVCDGHPGLVYYGRSSGWKIQRCHFHLIASIQGRRSRWGQSRHREEGERLYRLVTKFLHAPRDVDLLPLLTEIETMGWETHSRQLRKIIKGFVTFAEDYRTYRAYPGLHLPTTNNAAESLIGMVQALCYRTRGFRTPESFQRWIEALVKERKTIRCNETLPTE